MSLSKDDILSATDAQVETVKVPEWGGTVYIRVMSGKELEELTESFAEDNGTTQAERVRGLRARLAALTICNEKGERLFTNSDVEALQQKNALVLDRIFTAAQKLNGISEDSAENTLGK